MEKDENKKKKGSETKAMKFKAIVKDSYEAKHEDELTLTKGDTLNILDKDLEESGWWKGELNGQIGVFPDNCVEIIKEEPNPKKPPPPTKASETKPRSKLQDKIPADTEQSEPGPVKGPPTAVSNLKTEDRSHNSVTLRWTKGGVKDSVVRYKVGYTRVAGSECVRYVHVDNTSCVVDCLIPGTQYNFFVIACNEHGESVRSEEVNGTTLGPPAAVSDLKIEHMSHDCATLNWSNGAGKDSKVRYKVVYTRLGDSKCVRYVHVDNTHVDNTSCIVDCLSPGTEYKFFVIACNEHGESDRSMEVNEKTLELPTNWIELWVRRPGLIMAVIFLAFGVQYLFFGNIDNNKNLPDVIRDMEGRLEDYDMTISTLKKQHINEKGIFNDMVEKFKKEMKNITKTKLKELTNKVESASNDASSANEKLNDLEKAKKTLEDKYEDIEETFQRKIMNLESTFNDTISAVNNSVEKFEQTFSKHEESLEAFERKINRKMQEMTKTIEDESTRIKEQVDDFSKDFDKKLKKFKEAKSDLDKILVAVRKDVDTIKPNTFNKESLTMAFIIVVLFEFILALWIYLVQCGRSTYSDSSDGSKDMTARDVLERIPRRVALSDFVCIVSFDEARQTEHDTLVKSALGTMQDIQMKYFVVRRHEHLQKLPKCKFYIMCTEFSERHVIIEEPGLGLGDLKRCTYEVIQRYRANMVILYTRDPGSRSLGKELYNPNIYCVAKQPELIGLRDKGRFISTYDTLTEEQKRVLHDDIAKCMK